MIKIVHYQYDIGPGTYNLHPLPSQYWATNNIEKVTCRMCLRIINKLRIKNRHKRR